MEALLRTRDSMSIRYSGQETYTAALQLARNFYQYFAADCSILSNEQPFIANIGNIVTLCQGLDAGAEECLTSETRPIRLSKAKLWIQDASRTWRSFPTEDAMGAIFLAPAQDERLELIIWGFDAEGLRQAARLAPLLTGVGQPDFMIVSRRSAWEGAGGALAVGSFDFEWRASLGSYFA